MAKKQSAKRTTKSVPILHLDAKNPRLGRQRAGRSQQEIIKYLYEHDRALDVAESIALRGYFPIESLLAVEEQGKLVVVEGNRRLAALKGLHNPDLLDPSLRGKLQALRNRMSNPEILSAVPIVVAASRRDTDRTVAGRHIGQPVKAWQAEDRASFIMEKLDEGYSVDELRDELNFTLADIQKAKTTKAIAEVARALPITDEKARDALASERPAIFSTIGRIFDSAYARKKLHIESDSQHGFVARTSKPEIEKALTRVVSDIASGRETSRTLNNEDAIKDYFAKRFPKSDLPVKKQRTTTPDQLWGSKGTPSKAKPAAAAKPKATARPSTTVLPRNFKPNFGNKRIIQIADELRRMKRDDFPNGGAVLLRVFLELGIRDYLERAGAYEPLRKRLAEKNKLPHGHPQMKDLVAEVLKDIKNRLPKHEADLATKAFQSNASARFSISELHSFVHSPRDMPTAHDLEQFWERASPAMEMIFVEPLPEAES